MQLLCLFIVFNKPVFSASPNYHDTYTPAPELGSLVLAPTLFWFQGSGESLRSEKLQRLLLVNLREQGCISAKYQGSCIRFRIHDP
jgi:hypothetical protein